MKALVHTLLILLHVVTAAAWFGLALRIGGTARRLAGSGTEGAQVLAAEGAHVVRLMGIFVLLTLVFSLCALALGGGYAGQVQYHVASLLIVVLVAIQYLVLRPAWARLSEAALGDADATGALKRTTMGVGAGHLCWLLMLILMFWNRFQAVL